MTITEELWLTKSQLKSAKDVIDRFSYIIAEQEKEIQKLNARLEDNKKSSSRKELVEKNKTNMASISEESRLRDLRTQQELADAGC